MKRPGIILAIIVIAAGVFLLFVIKAEPLKTSVEGDSTISETSTKWQTKVNEQANVTIKVTPIDLDPKLSEWKFKIVMDTHSEELDHDLIKIISIRGDSQIESKPNAWEGSEPGGHHREGIITFNSMNPAPKNLEMKIVNVAGVPERLLKWNLDGNLEEEEKTASLTKKATNISDFKLFDTNGVLFDMENLAGKNTVFFFNEGVMCYPSCWQQISYFGTDPRFRNGNITAVAVVIDSPEEWQQAVKKMPSLSKTLTLFDKDGQVSRSLGLLDVESSMHKGEFPGHSYLLADSSGQIRKIMDDPKMGINNDSIIKTIMNF